MQECPVCGAKSELVPDSVILKMLAAVELDWVMVPILLNLARPYLDKFPYCHECKLIYLRVE